MQKKYHHGDLKASLVASGLELLEEIGLENLSLRAIAARAGVSHTAPKNHFDSFEALLAAIATEGFRLHAKAMRDGVSGTSQGKERLNAASEGYVRFARQHPALFRLMFSPRLAKADYSDLTDAANESYAVLKSISAGLEWPRRGPEQDSERETLRTEMMLWVFVHGYASLVNEGRMPRAADGEPFLGVLDVMPDFSYGSE